MKKVYILFLLLFILSGCVESQQDIHEDISTLYKDITLPYVLNYINYGIDYNNEYAGGIKLFYEDDFGSLSYYESHYYLDFNSETTFIYNPSTKVINKYTASLDESFQLEADDLNDFIQTIEVETDVMFRKFDYMIYDVIAEALLESNKDYVTYETARANSGAYHPFIVISSDNFNKFSGLEEIIENSDFDIEESVNVKLLLSRSFISNILFYMGSEYVRSEESDDLNLSDRIIQISTLF